MEKYYKVKKEHAARAGLNEELRREVEGDYLMLSEKDIRMISLTTDEKIAAIGASEISEEDIEDANKTVPVPEEENEEPGTDEEPVEDLQEDVEPENDEE